jgi:hypothetical protein
MLLSKSDSVFEDCKLALECHLALDTRLFRPAAPKLAARDFPKALTRNHARPPRAALRLERQTEVPPALRGVGQVAQIKLSIIDRR